MVKAISNHDFISVLIPTRGRPSGFKEMLSSLSRHAARHDLVDVWVYLDDDDPTAGELIGGGLSEMAGFPVHFHVQPRPVSTSGAFTELWRASTSNAGIFFVCVDDYLMTTPGWDERIRKKFSRYPDRIVVGQVTDPSLPNSLLFMALTAEWVNLLGYILPPMFPTWYSDAWLEQIADLVQRRITLGVEMVRNGGKGKTQRMRDLPFWYYFLLKTLPLRLEAADMLLRIIHEPGSPDFAKSCAHAEELAQKFASGGNELSDAQLMQMEELFTGEKPDTPPGRDYIKAKTEAMLMLYQLETREQARAS